MQAMEIANDALDSVLGNLKAALRFSIPILLLNIGVIGLLSYDFWQVALSGNSFGAQAILNDPFGTTRVIVIPLLVLVISLYWVTVAWHRFVILDEQPNKILPKLQLGRIWAYIWRLLVLVIVIAFVVGVPIAILANLFGGSGRINFADYSEALARGPVDVVFNVIGTTAFAYAFMRYSPWLVAAAVGRPISAGTARRATFWARKSIFVLAIGYAIVALIIGVLGSGFQFGFWPVDLPISFALRWVTFMFSISLLTTLYQKNVAVYSNDETIFLDAKESRKLKPEFYSRW